METFKVDLKQIIIFEIKISLQLCNISFFQHGREAEKRVISVETIVLFFLDWKIGNLMLKSMQYGLVVDEMT